MGRAVASDVADREATEWPPHPDRVFQALVDAWATHGGDPAEHLALEWLETLDPPALAVPDDEHVVWGGATPTVFVPTNDISGPSGRRQYGDNHLHLLPAHRTRKPRTFPATVVGEAVCALVWPQADAGGHREALSRLARQVTHIGRSTSLVHCWVEERPPDPTWVPASRRDSPDLHVRAPHPGRLRALVAAYADGDSRWRRPPTAPFVPYKSPTASNLARADNAGRMVILRRIAGAPFDLSHVLSLTRSLRSKLSQHAEGDALANISGHAPQGTPLTHAHLSIVPLAFVGTPYADGHVLGLALVMPTNASYELEDAILRPLAASLDRDTDAVTLAAPGGRSVSFAVEDRPAPPRALRPSSWTRASTTWATTTPIVLDRMPPRRTRDRDGFIRNELAVACERVGLPRPTDVVFGDVSPFRGVPHAARFPPLPTKRGLQRRHVHAVLRFETPIAGPVVLGAGRFRGMGFLRPASSVRLHDEVLQATARQQQEAP
jgi:CRISPR-associated protein Csb2